MRIPRTGFWRRLRPDEPSEEDAELRDIFVRNGFRLAAAFALIFGLVFFTLWWAGAAVRFGAARASDQVIPTWHVLGAIRNATTNESVPWAAIEDDPAGKAPFFHTDASYAGVYDLLTLAEPHQIRISASGYRAATVRVGRTWFLWLPRGRETRDVYLQPE